ncbi:hypothetical protein ACFWOL_02045 [Streptomyces sp. NPDC058442]|uniref:hypothetical protein n=1 Tax=Streptomyces sp. NPDC058442 TaxID=3346503 RepID=UPI003669156F
MRGSAPGADTPETAVGQEAGGGLGEAWMPASLTTLPMSSIGIQGRSPVGPQDSAETSRRDRLRKALTGRT